MYAEDNNDSLAENSAELAGTSWVGSRGSWVQGRALSDTNTTNIENGTLYPYNRAAGIYHCPSDRSVVENPHRQETQPVAHPELQLEHSDEQ
jgi:hypothetical protein